MLWLFLAVIGKLKWVEGISPLHLPHKGGVLGFGSRTGRTSRTGQTSPICPRTNTDSCSFAPFVLLRGLKTSIEFPLFSSYEAHKTAHERESANNVPFSRINTIKLSADFLIASADTIRKSTDTIRKLTERTKKLFTKKERKKDMVL